MMLIKKHGKKVGEIFGNEDSDDNDDDDDTIYL